MIPFIPHLRMDNTQHDTLYTNIRIKASPHGRWDAESLPRPHIYLALSSLTFDTSLCDASCFTSSAPLASNASALYRVSEFLGIKKRFLDIRENVRGAIKTTDNDIAKTALLAKGFREAGQTVANAFRTFADKPEADYSQKEQKHFITKAVLAPMKVVKKMFVLMELHLDASIDKLDNLAMNVQIDKEKRVENTKSEKQNVPDRAEAEPERVNAEIVYTPMVAEAHEYQYNADAFEARGGADVKVGTAEKVSKVREDKAR